MNTWLEEFGAEYEIPAEIVALDARCLIIDHSWHNDAMPSFSIVNDGSIRLWVDHPDASKRETPSAKRFSIALYDEDGAHLDDSVSSDDVRDVLNYLADHHDIRLFKIGDEVTIPNAFQPKTVYKISAFNGESASLTIGGAESSQCRIGNLVAAK